jgi:hypothetical protein
MPIALVSRGRRSRRATVSIVITEGSQRVKAFVENFVPLCLLREQLGMDAGARQRPVGVRTGSAAGGQGLTPTMRASACRRARSVARIGHVLISRERERTPVTSPSPKVASEGASRGAAAGHYCAAMRGMGCFGHHPGGVNQTLGHAGEPGAMTNNDLAPGGVRTVSRRLLGQLTDVAVAQPVVGERDDLAGHRDAGDLAGPGSAAVRCRDAQKVLT